MATAPSTSPSSSLLQATLSLRCPKKEAFVRHSGCLTETGRASSMPPDVRHIMTVLGQQLTDKEVFEMMHEANFDVDGQISYEEFVALLTST
ncbi:hypothetical protein MRX96_005750 [Rhipicephalus microplus]